MLKTANLGWVMLAGALLSTSANVSVARAADPGYCKHYAELAIWQYHRSQQIPNCYQGDNAVWVPNFPHHYDWCLGVSWEEAQRGEAIRGNRLRQCSMTAYGHP